MTRPFRGGVFAGYCCIQCTVHAFNGDEVDEDKDEKEDDDDQSEDKDEGGGYDVDEKWILCIFKCALKASLSERRQSYIGYICLTFLHCVTVTKMRRRIWM